MRGLRRLVFVALDRPRWQQVVACCVSLWALAWIVGQFLAPEHGPSALGVLGELAARVGLTGSGWAERVTETWQRSGGGLAIFGGLLWAATTERGQLPALLGWVAVMLGAERLGYRPAMLVAVAGMVGFILLLWISAQISQRLLERPTLFPHDVLRAGVTAAALAAVVPLYAPMLFLSRLGTPYLTRGPRPVPEQRRDDSGVTEQEHS
ncbi:hypothetical protein [Saccharopolyspora rhizosphaerae]|uniref:hypothetical protein n=1 Tax=Saccharopolyspora rhizosphaerae TaxID=2492662 RepID=UPI001F4893BB|nr:hypothetical protein [Saccharopolyspora rhizosphaerae]